MLHEHRIFDLCDSSRPFPTGLPSLEPADAPDAQNHGYMHLPPRWIGQYRRHHSTSLSKATLQCHRRFLGFPL